MSVDDTPSVVESNVTPRIFGLLLFGSSLVAIGTFDLVGSGEGAIVFSFFIAGFGELIAGVWEINVGDTHIGTVMAAFGTWLLGLFLLFSLGEALGIAGSTGRAIYFLMFVGPIVILYIPVYANRMPWNVHLTFISLFILQVFTGISFLVENQFVVWIAGVAGYIAAATIWYLCYEDVRDTMMELESRPMEATSTSPKNVGE